MTNKITETGRLLRNLQEEQTAIDREIDSVMRGDLDGDLLSLRRRQSDVGLKTLSTESQMLREKIRSQKQDRVKAQIDLENLEPQVLAAKQAWQQIRDQELKAYERWGELQVKAFQLDQRCQILFEGIADSKRRLAIVVSEVVGRPKKEETENSLRVH